MTSAPLLLPLQRRGDARGWLVVVEDGTGLPFAVSRVYYIGGTGRDVRRGFHAHYRTTQAAVCVNGRCMILLDDGTTRTTVALGDPDIALLLPPLVWHEMYDFSEDCVLLVFADAKYDESDYIRSYETFKSVVSQ